MITVATSRAVMVTTTRTVMVYNLERPERFFNVLSNPRLEAFFKRKPSLMADLPRALDSRFHSTRSWITRDLLICKPMHCAFKPAWNLQKCQITGRQIFLLCLMLVIPLLVPSFLTYYPLDGILHHQCHVSLLPLLHYVKQATTNDSGGFITWALC